MTRTLRGTVQYDGTAFAGFQRQPGTMTVQGALEAAIARVTQQPATVAGAGRTDAGVHALGQVIHFQTGSTLPLADLRRGINACLPDGAAVLDLAEAAPDFHARFSARGREYRYVVENAQVRSPLLRRHAHHVATALEVDAMAAAAAALEGQHDFAAFGAPMEHSRPAPDGGRMVTVRGGTIRTMLASRCWRRGRFVLFCFVADAFLRHMVRLLVGTLLRIGSGALRVDTIAALLGRRSAASAGPAVPAHGLYLVRVYY